MSTTEAAIEHVRVKCYQKQIRLSDFCVTYCKTGVKKITKMQFSRALDNALGSGYVTPAHLAAIEERFQDVRGYDIHFMDFCDLVDEAFATKNLEKNPTEVFSTTYAGQSMTQYGENLTNVEETELEIALEKVRKIALTEGAIVKSFFQPFDNNNNGCVTRTQFHRQLDKFVKDLEDFEVQLLIKRYAAGKLDVNYKAFHADVVPEGPPGTNAIRSEGIVRKPIYSRNPLAATDIVEDKIIKLCVQDRIRPATFFTDFNAQRSGLITRAQFQRGLHIMLGSRITQEEMDQLSDKYIKFQMKVEYIRFKDFCNTIEESFVTPGLQQNPMATSPTRAIRIATAPRNMPNVLSRSDQYEFDAAMCELTALVKTQRINIKPTFQDFDPRKEEHVTTTQFDRAVNKMSLKRCASSVQWNAIKRYFAANDNKRNGELLINYANFCAALEPVARPRSSRDRAGVSLVAAPETAPGRTAVEMVRQISLKCRSEKIRVKEMFTIYDGLRRRIITKMQFQRALDLAKLLPASTEEQEILCDAYSVGGSEVHYGNFESDVESATTVRGLEATPLIDVSATIASVDTDAFVSESRTDEVVAGALKYLNEKCTTEGLELVVYFRDYDISKNGCLPNSQVKRVFDNRRVFLEQEQVDALCRQFQSAHSLGQASKMPDVNYMALCRAVDQYTDGAAVPTSTTFRKTTRATTTYSGSSIIRKPVLPATGIVVDDIVREIREYANRNSIRMKEFLAESDTLRHGEITQAKFRTAMSQLGVTLTSEEVEGLIDEFKAESGDVNWRKLVDLLGERGEWKEGLGNGTTFLESDPMGVPNTITQTIFRNQISDQSRLQVVLQKVSNVCTQYRVHLKPSFQNYDLNNRRKLKKCNFIKVLDNQKVTERGMLSETDIEMAFEAYEVIAGGKRTGDVDYFSFCRDVDPATEKY